MKPIKKSKLVASQLKKQLSSAKKQNARKSSAKKLTIEFREKKTDIIYSYLLFQKGNTYINFSAIIEDFNERPNTKPINEIVEDILDKLDKPKEYELIKYEGKFDIEQTEEFDEKSLRFFVKEVKKAILNKIAEGKDDTTKSN